MEDIGARTGSRVEDTATGAPHFRIERVYLNLDVVDRFHRRVEHRSALHLGDRNPIEDVVVGTDTASTERNLRGTYLVLLAIPPGIRLPVHRRNESRDEEGISPRRRH